MAGTIGGNTYGIAKNTILHGIKILDRNGDGTTASLIQGKIIFKKMFFFAFY